MPNALFHKLRRADTWPSTTATVTATEQVSKGGRTGRTMNVFFTYAYGNQQSGKFLVDDNSSLYGLIEGEQFTIQFNPNQPSSYYCAEAVSLSQTVRRMIMITGVAFAAVVVLFEFFGGR